MLTPYLRNRYKCECPVGYGGYRCEHLCPVGFMGKNCNQPIKTCADYNHNKPRSGAYYVTDDSGMMYLVLCDFDHDIRIAWTLIQSYNHFNKNSFKVGLFRNHPINEHLPNWYSYRLSYLNMVGFIMIARFGVSRVITKLHLLQLRQTTFMTKIRTLTF